jgi:hypothetical protein
VLVYGAGDVVEIVCQASELLGRSVSMVRPQISGPPTGSEALVSWTLRSPRWSALLIARGRLEFSERCRSVIGSVSRPTVADPAVSSNAAPEFDAISFFAQPSQSVCRAVTSSMFGEGLA